ncbi:MAG: Trm112 family protein [Fimbriimonas sp.]
MIDPKLLAMLACPLDDNRPPLRQQGEWLICDQCQTAFPIEDGIPLLLPESGVPLESVKDKL